MYDNNSKGISYTAGFFILIGFTVAFLILATVVSIPIWQGMTGKSIKDMETAMLDPANRDAARLIQCITIVVGFLFPTILTAFLLNRKPFKLIGFPGKVTWQQTGLVFAIMFLSLFVSGFLSYVNDLIPIGQSAKELFEKMENEYNQQVEAIIGLDSTVDYLLALFIMAFLPALCEETLFRGGLQNFLTRATQKPWLSIAIVSILFSLAHLSFYGFFPRLFLGIILGLLYQYSGRIWLNIFGHFLNNAIALTALYVYKMQGHSLKDAINEKTSTVWGFLALQIVIVLIILFRKISQPAQDPSFSFEEPKEPLHGI